MARHHQQVAPPLRPWRCSARRWWTPKRCCSSITASARSLERHVGLEQRVRADHDVGVARKQGSPASVARPALLAPGQQPDAQPRRGRQRLQMVSCVLPRQHLGRRHQRRLAAALDRDQPSPSAPRRSCRSRHRPAAGASCGAAPHVLGDLGQRLALRAGEREGQRVGDPRRTRPSPTTRRPGCCLRLCRTSAKASWPASNSS